MTTWMTRTSRSPRPSSIDQGGRRPEPRTVDISKRGDSLEPPKWSDLLGAWREDAITDKGRSAGRQSCARAHHSGQSRQSALRARTDRDHRGQGPAAPAIGGEADHEGA